MLQKVVELSHALRDAGIPVALSETLDATAALTHVPPEHPEIARETLAATLIKDRSHRPSFDVIFNILFLQKEGSGADAGTEEIEEFRGELLAGLSGDGGGGLDGLAERAVEAFGRVENSPSGSLYFEYPVMRALDLERLSAEQREATEQLPPMEAMLARRRFESRVRLLREAIRREVQVRVAARRGSQQVLAHAVKPLLQEADLMTLDPDEAEALRRAIRPLARKLATRIAMKRRRSRRGGLDIRRTLRHSLSTGGVPLDIHLRKRVPHRPEVFILCDVSDSVARFSRFSLMLVHALSMQFSKIRSFVFIDTLDEVTRLFDHEDLGSAVDRINVEAKVVSFDGHSDYGRSLETFAERYGSAVTARTTILILGDARNNFRATGEGALKVLKERAHGVYWLNPEPVMFWDTGDSAASRYGPFLDDMVEVRNLRQLEAFIERTL